MAADGSGFVKVTPGWTRPGSPVPQPVSVTGDVPPPAPLPLTGDELFTVYVDDIPMFTTVGDVTDAGVSSFNGRTGAVSLTLPDVTGVGGAPIDSPVFTGDPQAPTPANGDNSNSIATTEFVTTAVDATFQDFLPITGGTLAGPGNLTVGGLLNVTGNATTSGIITNNAGYYIASQGPGAIKGLELDTGNLQRWTLFSDNTAELGANAGSNFQLSAYSDTGALLSTPISIQRSSGLMTLATGVVVSGGLSVTNLALFSGATNFTGATTAITQNPGNNSTLLATTAFVTSAIAALPPPTGGTVTSVGLAMPGDFTVSNSPVTGAGLITVTYDTQPMGTVFAAPAVFSGQPSFRALAASDIPLLNYLPLSGGAITGPVTAPTPTAGDNSTNVATTAFVEAAIAAGGGGGGGTGTVTSVSFVATPNTVFGVIGSPITSAGTINLVLSGQPQNSVLAAPVAAGGIPNFRLLTAADMPNLSGLYLPLTGGALTGPLTSSSTIAATGNIATGAQYQFSNSPANWYMWYDATAVQWKFATPSFTDAVAFTAAGAITTRGGLTLRGNAVITGSLAVTLATTLSNTLTVTGLSALNGGSTTITRPPGDNTTNIATTAFVTAAVAAGGGGGGGIPEAPTDGQIYGREGANTSWQPVLPLTGGTLSGPGNLTITGGSFAVNGSPSTTRMMFFQSNLSDRWSIFTDGAPESGGNAGSNFNIQSYNDSGGLLANVFAINRATGAVTVGFNLNVFGTAAFNSIPTAPTPTAGDSSTNIATTAFVHNAVGAVTGAFLPLTGGTLTGPLNVHPTTAGQSYIVLNDAAGTTRQLQFQTNGLTRWSVFTNSGAESGTQTGSDFEIAYYDNTGTYAGYGLYIYRSNGNAEFGSSLTVNQDLYVNGNAIFWGANGWYQQVTSQWTFQAPNGSCYMDANGNWTTNSNFYAAGSINAVTSININNSAGQSPSVNINGEAGTYRDLQYLTNGSPRWRIDCDPSAESGGNAGSNLVIYSYADSGAYIGAPFQIVRSTSAAYFLSSVTIGNGGSGNLYMTGTSAVAWPGGYYYMSGSTHVWVGSGTLATLDNSGHFTAMGNITAGGNITADGGNYVATNGAGTYRGLQIESSNTIRWWIAADTSAESGGNAGSNLFIANYDDNGNNLGSPFQMNRATGNALFTQNLTVDGNFTCAGVVVLADWTLAWGALGNGYYDNITTADGNRHWYTPQGETLLSDYYGNLRITSYGSADGNRFMAINGWPGTNRMMNFESNGVNRWGMYCTGTAETGSSAGSDFVITAANDAGAWVQNCLTIYRASGNVDLAAALTAGGTISAGSWIYSNNGGRFIADGPAGDIRGLAFTTSQQWRWFMYADSEAESGGNAGSNLILQSYSDAGSPVSTALIINRASGAATFASSITSGGNIQSNGNWFFANGTASFPRGLQIQTSGVTRWSIDASGTAESGGNVGSDLQIIAYTDAGVQNGGPPLSINRANGLVTCGGALQVNADCTVTGMVYVNGAQTVGANRVVVGYFQGGAWYNAERFAVNTAGSQAVVYYNAGANMFFISVATSDRRLKSNLKPAGDALSLIKRLAVYDLDFKQHGKAAEGFAEPPTEHWPFSLIADEVADVMPHAAMKMTEDDGDHWVGLHPQHLVATLWRAVQQLSDKVETLEARLAAVGG